MEQKYHIITYGCQMNKSDSERIAAVLESAGYQKAQRIEEAGLIVVNMCSVRQSAVDRVYGLQPKFEKLKKQNPRIKTILTGCVLEKDKKKLAKKFDLILSIKNLSSWLQKKNCHTDYLKISPKYSSFPTTYVPISTGCNNFCAYCVVPYVRGPELCRRPEEILEEVKCLVKQGYKEIWLLGQNVNRYRSKSKIKSQKSKIMNFAVLLKEINDIPGDFWVRFTSPHPKDFSDELIKTMAAGKKITPYLNLPVQSGDDKILKKMNRGYTAKQYKNLVKKIRQKIPDISLSTDIIVGFPGETKKQFENTKNLFKEIKFAMAYIAQYSPREQTVASKMKDNVPQKEKKRREKILTALLKQTAFEKNKKFIGKIIKVLPVTCKNGFLIGKSWHHQTVKFRPKNRKPKELIGKFQEIKVRQALPWGLAGRLIIKK